MSVITDDSNNIIDPEAEVRKLQDLVKKLEQQNQLLRNKQNEREKDDVFSRTETLDTDFITTPPSKNGPDPAVLKESLKNLTLDDVALVEVDGETQEEDSWYAAWGCTRLTADQQTSVDMFTFGRILTNAVIIAAICVWKVKSLISLPCGCYHVIGILQGWSQKHVILCVVFAGTASTDVRTPWLRNQQSW